MNTGLLAFHVTLALALTILLGVQCAELGRLRRSSGAEQTSGPSAPLAVIAAIPVVTVVVAVTGGMLLGAGAHGGPWIGAGVFSSLVIAASALWTLRLLRRRVPVEGAPSVAAIQWGAPAFTLAAAFLMAARPQDLPTALTPVLLALVVTLGAYLRDRTGQVARA